MAGFTSDETDVMDMKCPTDGTTLALSERNGIEIDYCPECRGVWLDRGELDKILERADTIGQPQPTAPAQSMPPGYPPQVPPMDYGYDEGGHHGGGHGGGHGGQYGQYGKRRRGGWLGELFD